MLLINIHFKHEFAWTSIFTGWNVRVVHHIVRFPGLLGCLHSFLASNDSIRHPFTVLINQPIPTLHHIAALPPLVLGPLSVQVGAGRQPVSPGLKPIFVELVDDITVLVRCQGNVIIRKSWGLYNIYIYIYHNPIGA